MQCVTAARGGAFTIARDFDAPRELVWRALLDPEQLVCHWPPAGSFVPLASITIEPWLGGRFQNTMVDEAGVEYRMACTFLDAVEPERFTFCEPDTGIVTTTHLVDLGGVRTLVVVEHVHAPEPYLSPEALAGFEASFDRLAAHLSSRLAQGQPVGPKRSTRMRSTANPRSTSRWLAASANPADPQT